MGQVADLLGMAIEASDPKVAVVRCNGGCESRPRVAEYDGLHTCAAMNATGAGETACGYGCLGCGDCAEADEDHAVLEEIPVRMARNADSAWIWCEVMVCLEGLFQGVVYDMAV